MKLVTGEQMHDMDKIAIQQYGLPGIVLMENAASQVALEAELRYGPLRGRRVAVVCGKGNNGGDGIAAARHLSVRCGADVTIWLAEPMDTASPDTALNLMAARNYGIATESISDQDWLLANLKASYLVVDAVLGTGVQGDPRPAAAAAIDAINRAERPVLSIDVPSGLTDTGKPSSPTVQASTTVTLALPKLGLFLAPGIELAGELVVVDISFPPDVTAAKDINTIAVDCAEVRAWLPKRTNGRDSNKGSFGSVAIVAGSPGFLGAACLASTGASRAGAGLVTLAVPDALFSAMMTRAPETVMTQAFPSSESGSFGGSGEEVLRFIHKRDSVGFGCGIGAGDDTRIFARRLIAECEKPIVIDADALTLLSMEPDHGAALVRTRKAPTVMTPHPGELARLLGIDTRSVQNDRLAAVKQAASTFGAVVVLKGQATLVAHPDGRLAVNTTGNPGMAAGGSGDVLTGITATLLAQIADPWEAAAAAAFVHGLAGDIAAKEIGMAGLLATDLAVRVPAAIAKCYE